MAQGRSIVTAVVVLTRASFFLGLLAFLTGIVAVVTAAIGVRTGNVTEVAVPVWPVGVSRGTVAIPERDEEEVSVLGKRSSKLSLEL